MKTPLKIAIYSGEIPSTTFIERLITGLSDAGVQLLLFGVLNKKPKYNTRVHCVAYRANRLSKLWHLVRFTVLLTLFKRADKKWLDSYLKKQHKTDLYTKVKYYPVLWHQPDIFHIQWAKGLDDWIWVQEFGIKLVLSLRGAHINYSPIADEQLATMYKENFPKVHAFHAVSKAIGLEAQIYGAAAERIHTVYSGLPITGVSTPAIKQRTNVLRIISIGRPHWKKGYSYALDACKILKESALPFTYTIIGGANEIEYQYQLHDLGLEDCVKLLGQKPFQDVQARIQEADVLLLPSVEEGLANVVLEAMALGTLVLSTHCGGMKEVITDGENGFLVPFRDAQAIADALKRIKALSESDASMIRKRAQETILKQHASGNMVRGMLELYNGL